MVFISVGLAWPVNHSLTNIPRTKATLHLMFLGVFFSCVVIIAKHSCCGAFVEGEIILSESLLGRVCYVGPRFV